MSTALKRKRLWLLVSVILVVILVITAVVGGQALFIRLGGLGMPYHPDTTDAPVLELAWDGELTIDEVTRYTPYGIWENLVKTPNGTVYEPAHEMQFYVKTDKEALLAVAPGVLWTSEVHDKKTGVGTITVRYGKHYSVSYYHVIPDSTLKRGQIIKTGDRLGKMEKMPHPHFGEETWWEISMAKYDPATRLVRTVPPYDYFNKSSQQKLDAIANASKEISPNWGATRTWTVTEGCSWAKYTKKPEWWANFGRLGAAPVGAINQSQEDFISALNPSWKVGDRQGRVLGPTDDCGY